VQGAFAPYNPATPATPDEFIVPKNTDHFECSATCCCAFTSVVVGVHSAAGVKDNRETKGYFLLTDAGESAGTAGAPSTVGAWHRSPACPGHQGFGCFFTVLFLGFRV
jgi:hypothetical protein